MKQAFDVSSTKPHRRAKILVAGRVQGVFFRASTERRARELGLTGFVRNRMDGTVEIEAEGSPARVDELIAWCGAGPPGARVDDLRVEEQVPCGDQRFTVRYR